MKAFFKFVGFFFGAVCIMVVAFYIYSTLLYFTGLTGYAPVDYKLAREQLKSMPWQSDATADTN